MAGAAAVALAVRSPAPLPRAEILWDTWGVPHVYGQDAEAVLYGFGWAQAQAHGDLLLELYGQARGRAAEYWGPERADGDRLVRMLGIPRRAEAWYAAQIVEERALLDAFAQGINDYAREHPEAIDDSMELVLPVRGADILAHVQHAIHFTFLSSPAREIHLLAAGSNAWAIAPSRSASGHAMLLANPHLPWSGIFTWFEAHLVAPGLDAYGVTFVGMPFLGVAFNERLGWSHTVNPIDGADLYELTLVEGGYEWDGGVRLFEARVDTIRIRAEDGSLRAEPLLILESVHGPVIAREGDKLYALRVAGLDQPHLLGQYWQMARARDLAEFEAALARLQMPMFNTIYADRDGHVLFVFNGRVPVRRPSDWDVWAGKVRGDTSATLWTEIHPYSDLPRVLDPPSGWIQNANDPPWTATLPPLDPADYPSYFAPRGMDFRPQRSIRMLVEDDTISFDEMVAYKHSTRMELADRLLDDLVPPARARGEIAGRAAEVLDTWDRSADAGSRGGVLFQLFFDELGRRYDPLELAFVVPWDPERPLETPDGLADPELAVDALAAAAQRADSAFGALDVAWGDIHRLRRDSIDLPGNGADDRLGVFRVTNYSEDSDGRFRANRGDTYIAVIEFGDPLRAMGLLGYGNWSQPGSPHRTDQLPLFAEKRLRPIWRERAEIEAHLELQETLP
jgi:acyl-homoserine-lactone acylase